MGASITTVQSTLTISKPASATAGRRPSPAARIESASRQRSSVSGKCSPMSPSPRRRAARRSRRGSARRRRSARRARLVGDLDAAENQLTADRRGDGSHSRCQSERSSRALLEARPTAPPVCADPLPLLSASAPAPPCATDSKRPGTSPVPIGSRRRVRRSNTHSSLTPTRRAARAPARSRRRRPRAGGRRWRARRARRRRGTSQGRLAPDTARCARLRRPAVETSMAIPDSAIASIAGS